MRDKWRKRRNKEKIDEQTLNTSKRTVPADAVRGDIKEKNDGAWNTGLVVELEAVVTMAVVDGGVTVALRTSSRRSGCG